MEMYDFITVMRAKRQMEMNNYQDKGYEIQNRKHYIMLEKIKVPYMGNEYEYSVQFTQDEVYFFIDKNGGNIYLSIAEIYQLLRELHQKDGGYLLDCLMMQLNQNGSEKIKFSNHDLSYKMTDSVRVERVSNIGILQTGICVTSVDLFLLILLIQEKSNAFFRKGARAKKQYVNGLLRLLIVLTEYKNDDVLLSSLGWKWNCQENMFNFEPSKSLEGREKYKYYLTRQEFNDKMLTKKS